MYFYVCNVPIYAQLAAFVSLSDETTWKTSDDFKKESFTFYDVRFPAPSDKQNVFFSAHFQLAHPIHHSCPIIVSYLQRASSQYKDNDGNMGHPPVPNAADKIKERIIQRQRRKASMKSMPGHYHSSPGRIRSTNMVMVNNWLLQCPLLGD